MGAIEQRDPKSYGDQAVATSYYGFGGDASLVQHVHIQWDAAIIATITFEASDFADVDASAAPVKAGDWVPATATSIDIVAGSCTLTSTTTITLDKATAGGALVTFQLFGARRGRVKVVCTTHGNLRIGAAGKQ